MPPTRPSTAQTRPSTAQPAVVQPRSVASLLSLVSALPVVHQTKNQRLRQCASQNDEPAVAALLSFPSKSLLDRIDVNDSDEWGMTAMHYAASNGNASMVDDLLHYGASVNQRDNDGATPLHAACQRGHLAVVQRLINAKANVNAVTHSGFTPLMKLASVCNVHTPLIADLLLQNKAKLDATSKDGLAALHIAAQASNIAMIDFLLEHGANVNIATKDGRTALHMALESHKNQIAATLVSFGASVDIEDARGQTPRKWIDAAVVASAEGMKHKREVSHQVAAEQLEHVQHAWQESNQIHVERAKQIEQQVQQELNSWRDNTVVEAPVEAKEQPTEPVIASAEPEKVEDIESEDDTEAQPVEEETEEDERKRREFRAKMFAIWESHSTTE